MSEVQVEDEIVGGGNASQAPSRGLSTRRVINESVDERTGEMVTDNGGADDDRVMEGDRKGRVFKPSTLALLAKLEEAVDDGEETTNDTDDVGLVEGAVAGKPIGAPAAEAKPGEAPKVEAKVEDAAPSEIENIRAENARLLEANRKLVADYDTITKKPKTVERGPIETTLLEAEASYLDDPIMAVRKFLGVVMNAAHDSKEVNEELSGLYADLTAKELNVPLEQAHKASREAARAKQMLSRDKRERKAEAEQATKAKESPDADKDNQQFVSHVNNHLSVKRADGKSIAEAHPLLMTYAKQLDGVEPAQLVWHLIQRETRTGNLDSSKMNDEQLIAAASAIAEKHYRGLAEQFAKSIQPPVDTTKQQTPNVDASKAASQQTGARTITNATASVAPATPPAQKPNTEPGAKPKFKSRKEAQDYALRHLPK